MDNDNNQNVDCNVLDNESSNNLGTPPLHELRRPALRHTKSSLIGGCERRDMSFDLIHIGQVDTIAHAR